MPRYISAATRVAILQANVFIWAGGIAGWIISWDGVAIRFAELVGCVARYDERVAVEESYRDTLGVNGSGNEATLVLERGEVIRGN